MKVGPTLDGGLAIEPSSETDWDVLAMITKDIGRPAHLAESLAGLMADDSEWEEYVVPDLTEEFDKQSACVATAVNDARSQEQGTIFIKRENAELWYGAINQARLAIEARYKLSELEDIEEGAHELYKVYIRDRFCLTLLSLLLDYVMNET